MMTHEEIEQRLDQVLSRASSEYFEDGMTSCFEKEFRELFLKEDEEEIDLYKKEVVTLFIEKLKEKEGEVLREALGILARLYDRKVSALYRQFIHESIYHNDLSVRDGAIAAIEYMEHFRSEPVLRAYYNWETVPYLKEYAGEVLVYFESYYDDYRR